MKKNNSVLKALVIGILIIVGGIFTITKVFGSNGEINLGDTKYKCSAGEYKERYLIFFTRCSKCKKGSYCPGDDKAHKCAAGKGSKAGATKCSNCASGYYSKGDGKGCVKCPSGTVSNEARTACVAEETTEACWCNSSMGVCSWQKGATTMYSTKNTEYTTKDQCTARCYQYKKSDGSVEYLWGNYSGSVYTLMPTITKRENCTPLAILWDKTGISLGIGGTRTLEVPKNGDSNTMTWKSSDAKVATVSANGIVKGVAFGTATISVTTSDGRSASCKVTVRENIVEPTGITLSKTSITMIKGSYENIKITLTPSDNDKSITRRNITWITSNNKVAKISSAYDSNGNEIGEIEAVGEGTATITAKTSNGKIATCKVTVLKERTVESITLDHTNLTLDKGGAGVGLKVNPTTLQSNVSWSSSNKKVATVDSNGLVKPIGAGTATITAKTSNGKTATCKVTVKEMVEIPKITLNKTTLTVEKGSVALLMATVTNSESQVVTWKSSNEKIAKVEIINRDGSGNVKIKGIGEGTATITATTSTGSKATCKVTVKAKVEISKITLNKTTLEIQKGSVVDLKATVTNAKNANIVWTSSNKKIAKVEVIYDSNGNEYGEVTGVSVGTATITATTSTGLKATCKVTVKETPVSSIKLDKTSVKITVGEGSSLLATISPTDATDKTLVWTSSDTSVVSVSELLTNNGLNNNVAIKGLKEGTATITATTKNGKKTTCKVTVVKKSNPITVIEKQSLTLTSKTTAQSKTFVGAKDAKGTLTYKIHSQMGSSGNKVKYFSIPTNTKASIKVAADTPKGTYTVSVYATGAGNNTYKSGTREIILTVKVK